MTYKIDDKIDYFFKGDEDNEPCEDVMVVKALKDLDNEEVFKFKPTTNNKEWDLSEVLMNKLILQMDNAPITIEG